MKGKNQVLYVLSILVIVGLSFVIPCYAGSCIIEQKIKADDGSSGDLFGASVFVVNNYYAIVGAFFDDDNGESSGSAYIFERNGNFWIQAAKLTADDGSAYDRFGQSVSMTNDYAIVGAHFDDDNGEDSGSAYIFERQEQSWIYSAKLTAIDASSGDDFGGSVSATKDFAIVGAMLDDDNGDRSGSAYIFGRSGCSWIELAKLKANDASANKLFGCSVSITANFAIVGAWRDNVKGSYSGSVYIFKRKNRNGTSWVQVAKLTASDGTVNDYFGMSVSATDNYLLVGAEGDDDNGKESGSAYIFKRNNRSGTSWTQVVKLTANDGATQDLFGRAVSITDYSATVGAPWKNGIHENCGAVYLYKRRGKRWVQSAKLTPSDATPGSNYGGTYFGSSVSTSRNYWIIGAEADDDYGASSGAAYIYKK